jgi:hypothetical protein
LWRFPQCGHFSFFNKKDLRSSLSLYLLRFRFLLLDWAILALAEVESINGDGVDLPAVGFLGMFVWLIRWASRARLISSKGGYSLKISYLASRISNNSLNLFILYIYRYKRYFEWNTAALRVTSIFKYYVFKAFKRVWGFRYISRLISEYFASSLESSGTLAL